MIQQGPSSLHVAQSVTPPALQAESGRDAWRALREAGGGAERRRGGGGGPTSWRFRGSIDTLHAGRSGVGLPQPADGGGVGSQTGRPRRRSGEEAGGKSHPTRRAPLLARAATSRGRTQNQKLAPARGCAHGYASTGRRSGIKHNPGDTVGTAGVGDLESTPPPCVGVHGGPHCIMDGEMRAQSATIT